jgi:hypothetical protein
MILLEDDCIVFVWEENVKAIVGTWKGKQPSGEKVKATFNKLLEIVSDKKPRSYLADTREMPPMNKELEVWLTQNWLPRILAIGVKYFATVVPTSALARITLDSLVKTSKLEGVPMFDNVEEAWAWLKAQP